ncbi:MAG: undecaprenyl-diphosphate phosphatase [Candidatus Moraniibacteriota bacterium]|jgi:undecaprenyl-diphosphatase
METTLLQSIIFGIVQGITEFLPISSSGHLVLLEYLFGMDKPQISFFVALHISSLLAVVIYFWRDWLNLFWIRSDMEVYQKNPELLWYIIVATIPAVFFGIIFNDRAEALIFSPIMISLLIVLGSFILFTSDKLFIADKSMEKMTFKYSLLIGLAQIVALIPGVSRSGMTIAGARIGGFTREDAARFSFLIATPIIAGAGIMQLKYFSGMDINTWIGCIISFIFAMLTIHYFLALIKKISYAIFLYYSLALFAVVSIIFYNN